MRRMSVVLAAGVVAGFGVVSVGAAPVPPDAGKLPPPTKEQVRAAVNNLKQIGLAFHNYHDVNGHLPNNVYTKDGKPLLSWRVHLLPYIEETPLYQQFKLDQAWDSDHNKKLVEKMPKLYAPVRVKAKAGETFYRAFAGKNAPFGPDHGKGLHFAKITDGLSNTGLVFEAAEPVIWTKPDDLPFDGKPPLPKLGGLFDGEAHVVVGDGSVRLLKKDADEKELRKFIAFADGEAIDPEKLEK